MGGNLENGVSSLGQYRTLIAIGLPLFCGALVVASSILMPRGKAKGLITGLYMLLASLGGACLLFAGYAALTGGTRNEILGFLLPGIVLTVIMGIFSPAVIREYQLFEFRKLAAEIFRRSS
jgi:hypothetical protein